MSDVKQQVWSELFRLTPVENFDLGIAAATLGNIVNACGGTGFSKRQGLTEGGPERDRWDFVSKAAHDGASGTYSNNRLSSVAALVEVNPDGQVLKPEGYLWPSNFSWIDHEPIVLGTYATTSTVSVSSRRYSLMVPGANAASTNAGYLSMLTGTGMVKIANASGWRIYAAWAFALIALFGFCLGAGSVYWTGNRIAQSYEILSGTSPGYSASVTTKFEQELKWLSTKEITAKAPTNWSICRDWVAKPIGKDKDILIPDEPTRIGCMLLWSSASRVSWAGESPSIVNNAPKVGSNPASDLKRFDAIFGFLTRPSYEPGSLESSYPTILVPTLLMMISVLLLAIAAGLGVVGIARGILINEQNRVSLARLQVLLWSVIVLPVVIAYACFNAGTVVAFPVPTTALELFPKIPLEVLGALGIAFASPMISSLILRAKDLGTGLVSMISSAATQKSGDVSTFRDAPSLLSKHSSPKGSSFADVLLGEENGNENNVDTSRVQMLVITVGLVFTYFVSLASELATLSLSATLTAISQNTPLLKELPSMGGSFVALLLASHSAYLVGKNASKPEPNNTTEVKQ